MSWRQRRPQLRRQIGRTQRLKVRCLLRQDEVHARQGFADKPDQMWVASRTTREQYPACRDMGPGEKFSDFLRHDARQGKDHIVAGHFAFIELVGTIALHEY